MGYMLHLFRGVLLDQEVQCLKVLGLVVVMPSGIQVMVNMTTDLVAVALHLTFLGDHVFPIVVITFPPMRHGMFGFFLILLLRKWLNIGTILSLITPMLWHLLLLCLSIEHFIGLDNIWLIDFGCSHHITESPKRFSSLNLVHGKKFIIFGDNNKGKVVFHGAIQVNESFILKDVALVENLCFILLSILQLLEDGFEVHFKKGGSCVLDSRGVLFARFFLLVMFFMLTS